MHTTIATALLDHIKVRGNASWGGGGGVLREREREPDTPKFLDS